MWLWLAQIHIGYRLMQRLISKAQKHPEHPQDMSCHHNV